MLNLTIMLVGLLGVTFMNFRTRILPVREPESTSVSVVVPARNEAHALPLLLTDLSDQTMQPREVIVVDDDSTDETASLARAAGVTVLAAPARPGGWNPKVWALHVGSRAATGERLLFLDADIRLDPTAVASVVRAGHDVGGVLSVAPFHTGADERLGLIESLSAPFNVLIVAAGGLGFQRTGRGAIGTCLTIDAATYRSFGGHGAVPNTIVDDMALAGTARAASVPVTMMRSDKLISVRSYPAGLRAVIDGWSKSVLAGMQHSPLFSSVIVGLWITSLMIPVALLAQGQVRTSALAWAAVALHTGWLTRGVGRFNWPLVTVGAPILGLFVSYVSVRALVAKVLGRTVDWKGRDLTSSGLEEPR